MIEKQILNCLSTNYGIEVVDLTLLTGGADINATVYKVRTRDQSSYFLKVRHGHQDIINIALVELLHHDGIQEIIPPIKTTQGHPILYIDDFSLIVYPFIEGVNGFSHKLTHNQWVKLGKVLRQVHDFTLPVSFLSHIRRETYSPKWREAVRSLFQVFTTKDALAQRFLDFMQEHQLVIRRLVDRAEQLCHKIQEQFPHFVLCHSDIHAGNVLIEGSETLYIVDWDAPILAPKERDLMFIGGGIANVWNDFQEETYFYKGYGKTEINRTILAYYRHERIVEDIAVYGEALLSPASSEKDRLEMYQQFLAMFVPHGVVDIAFKTDEVS